MLSRCVKAILLLAIALLVFSPGAHAAALAASSNDVGQQVAALMLGDLNPSSAIVPVNAPLDTSLSISSPLYAAWTSWLDPSQETGLMLQDPDPDAQPGKLTSVILAVLVFGTLLKLFTSAACREFLTDIYYPRSY